MYYELLVNGKSVGVFGHQDSRNLHFSVGASEEGIDLFASGVCREDNENIFYDWLQKSIGPDDIVEIRPSSKGDSVLPRKTFAMNRSERIASDKNVCDFCQKNEAEVSAFVHIDQHRPSICAECVELCNEILRGTT